MSVPTLTLFQKSVEFSFEGISARCWPGHQEQLCSPAFLFTFLTLISPHHGRMRFSGVLVDEGIRLLERSLLPACQKTGKKIFLLLSSHDVFLVQDETEAHGMHVVAGIKAVRWILLSISNRATVVE